MAKIFVVDRENKATVKAFAVSKDYQADLIWCEVDREYNAKGDALWFFVDRDNKATTKLFWVDKEYKADLKVFKTDKTYNAKWKKSHKMQNRL